MNSKEIRELAEFLLKRVSEQYPNSTFEFEALEKDNPPLNHLTEIYSIHYVSANHDYPWNNSCCIAGLEIIITLWSGKIKDITIEVIED